MLLEKFVHAKASELAQLRQLERSETFPAPSRDPRPDFSAAISRRGDNSPLAVIAEYKRASPSRGQICGHLTVEEVADQYNRAGASAMSVLTEERFFDGSPSFLDRAAAAAPMFPLLRKDFIFDSLQVRYTAATRASALLLIVRLTPDPVLLRDLREEAEAYGMTAVVEIFDESDLSIARESGARIMQVNARDLASLSVDRRSCMDLARKNPPCGSELWIAASGISRGYELIEAADAGFSAVLVGSALMQTGRPGQTLAGLLAEARKGVAG